MKRFVAVFLLLITLSGIAVTTFAHSGRTDSNGGHYSGGSYHYHHGYPAHQHTHGVCPYDYDDKTGENSGSSAGSGSGSSNNGSAKKDNETQSAPSIGKEKETFWEKEWLQVLIVVLLMAFSPTLLVLLTTTVDWLNGQSSRATFVDCIENWRESWVETLLLHLFYWPVFAFFIPFCFLWLLYAALKRGYIFLKETFTRFKSEREKTKAHRERQRYYRNKIKEFEPNDFSPIPEIPRYVRYKCDCFRYDKRQLKKFLNVQVKIGIITTEQAVDLFHEFFTPND